eukprot:jgi/Botrbrau1/7914/Bobra.9_2s0082.1
MAYKIQFGRNASCQPLYFKGRPQPHALHRVHVRKVECHERRSKEDTGFSSVRLALAVFSASMMVVFPAFSQVDKLPAEEDAKYEFPQQLASSDEAASGAPLSSLLSGKNGKQIQNCSRKCMPGCIRGGEGAPGLGPITVRKDLVVFKEGFRSRQYCLTECTQVCALSYNGPGPGKAQ